MFENVIQYFEKNKYLFLLLSLLFFFITSSLISDAMQAKIILGILFSIILVFSTYIIYREKYLLYAAATAAVLTFISSWISTFFQANHYFLLFNYSISTIFFLFITVMILSYVMRDKVISSATLYGAICGYLLIGLSWSFLYLIVSSFDPNAFNVFENRQVSLFTELKDYIYYSFVCLSTLGFGDLVPRSDIARTLSWMEAITGQIYLTVWIARLVGIHVAQQGQS